MIVGGWEYVWVVYAIVWTGLATYGGSLVYRALKLANEDGGKS